MCIRQTQHNGTIALVMCIWCRRVVLRTSQCSRTITAADHSHQCDVIVLHACLCLSHRRREGGQCFIQDHGHTRSWQTQRHTDKWENTIENLAKSEDAADRGADRHPARLTKEVILHIVCRCRCNPRYKNTTKPRKYKYKKTESTVLFQQSEKLPQLQRADVAGWILGLYPVWNMLQRFIVLLFRLMEQLP